jgi:transketolase
LPAAGAAKGAYVVAHGSESSKECDVILLATGSEVSIALQARLILAAENIKARVVSLPSFEWFTEQPVQYQEEVLPKSVKARVSVEAGVAQPWYKLIGDCGVPVSLEHYGASASPATLFKEYGFTPENIAVAAKESIRKASE